MDEFDKFYGKIWEIGGTRVITIPKQIIDGNGLKNGDKLKVMMRKVEQEDEDHTIN